MEILDRPKSTESNLILQMIDDFLFDERDRVEILKSCGLDVTEKRQNSLNCNVLFDEWTEFLPVIRHAFFIIMIVIVFR